MADWAGIGQGIGAFEQALAGQFEQERQNKQAMAKMLFENQVKNQGEIQLMRQKAQLAQEMMGQMGGQMGGSMNPIQQAQSGIGQGIVSSQQGSMNPIEGVQPFLYVFNPDKLNYDRVDNPQYKLLEKEMSPLSGDAAGKYTGAIQGLSQLDDIVRILGFNEQGVGDIKKAKDLIYRANLAIEGTNAQPTFVPGLQGAYRMQKNMRAGDDGQRLANSFMTVAENLLRARTGAAAPDPEIVREYARSLLKSFVESPDTWHKKLQTNRQFLQGVAQGIKPNTWQQDYERTNQMIAPKGGDVRAQYNQLRESGMSPEQAKQQLGL